MATLTRTIREYVDLDFNFTAHPITDNLTIKKNDNAVKQALTNLLTLREGDKPFHPEIHSPIYPYLFDNFTIIAKLVLEEEVKKYIRVYEPRVKVTRVDVSSPNPNDLLCVVEGEIINIQEPFTVKILIERLR